MFKVGEKVIRTGENFNAVKHGETYTVSRANETVNFKYSKACTYRLVVREV